MAPRRSRGQQRARRQGAGRSGAGGGSGNGARSYRRPRRPWWSGPGAIVAALMILAVLVAAFVAIARSQNQEQKQQPQGGQASAGAVVQDATHVSPGVLDAVGTGSVQKPLKPTNQPTVLQGPNGRPQVLYIGAEWCPYCAAERWSLVVALSRFGTFSNVGQTTSSGSDAFPNTPTFSFHNATYQSSVIDFVPVETQDRNRKSLRSPTTQEQQLMRTYDPDGSIPFVLIGGRMYETGSGFQPDTLAGQSAEQIASGLGNPSAASTQAIVGNANVLTAAICQVANGQPAAVCQSQAVQKAQAQLS
jgi:hypothetical protein